MHVVPITEAPPYQAPGHTQMHMRRLQGLDAGPADSLWIGLSVIAPAGGTTAAASEVEKFYVCIEGEVEVEAELGGVKQVTRLGPLDSCRIAPHESRRLCNKGAEPARLLLVMQLAPPRQRPQIATNIEHQER
ncbi:cupin domain-containing protein [Methylibium sp.]|uniref:cupin domain-containing protein n=1 Tax=Methylibium sp. TaxID=2067992 RepID=UPI003D0D37F6